MDHRYTRLEYIESTGTQYIDTGLTTCTIFGFDIKFMAKNDISTTNYGCILGGRYQAAGTNNQEIALTTYSTSGNAGLMCYGDSNTNAGIVPNTIQECSFKLKNYIRPDKSTYSFSTWPDFFNKTRVLLFAMQSGGTGTVVDKSSTRLYECKLYHSEKALYRYFIPAKRNSDGVIGLYDEILGTFYTNQGTGTFIAGPELSLPASKAFNIYTDNEKFSLYMNSENLDIIQTSKYGSVLDDVYANNYIEDLDSLTISKSGNNLVVNFTPCTNTELLNRVSSGKTRVRIQLLVHKVSSCNGERSTRGSHNHCIKLPPGYYWDNDPQGHLVNGSSTWARTKGRYDDNQLTYIDLSVAQLTSGTVTFTNAICHAHGPNHCSSQDLGNMSVEMFCPALYRRNKDIYYYERNGYRYLADNYVQWY